MHPNREGVLERSQQVKSRCDNCFEFGERAAHIEYDGGLDRERAEKLARMSVCAGCRHVEFKIKDLPRLKPTVHLNRRDLEE